MTISKNLAKENLAHQRILDTFELLEKEHRDLSFTEIRSHLRISNPTTSRLLHGLKNRGYLLQDPHSKRFRLGLRFLSISGAILEQLNLRKLAYPFMKELSRKGGETVLLAIMEDDHYIYIDILESPESIKLVVNLGYRSSRFHSTGTGKVFLAYMEDKKREAFLALGDLEKRTEYTIVDPNILRSEIKKSRLNGFAFDYQESRIGVCRWAAPIFDHESKLVGVITIAGPIFRMPIEKSHIFGNLVKEAAQAISRQMGYRPVPIQNEDT